MIDERVRELERRATEQPDDPDGWIRLGRALARADRAAEAADAFGRARALDPTGREARAFGDPSDEELGALRIVARPCTGNARTHAIAFAPGGGRLAVAGSSRQPVVLDTASWTELAFCTGQDVELHCVAFSPDGRRLVAAGRFGRVLLWDLPAVRGDGPPPRVGPSVGFDWEEVPREGLLFTPDGRHVLSAVDGPALNLWDAASGALLRSLSRPGEATVVAVACAPVSAGPLVAVADANGRVTLRDLATGAIAREVAAHDDRVVALAFAARGRLVLSASADGLVVASPLDGGAEVRLELGARVSAVAPSERGGIIAALTVDGMLKVHRLGGRELLCAPTAGSGERGVLRWDATTSLLASLQGALAGVTVHGLPSEPDGPGAQSARRSVLGRADGPAVRVVG